MFESGRVAYSTMRSSNLRLARLAGEKTTISVPNDMARQAQKMAIEKVLPKRRGVEMSTSLEQRCQEFFFMIAGLCMTRVDVWKVSRGLAERNSF